MIRLSVNVEDAGAMSGIGAILAALEDREGLHEALAIGVGDSVREHLRTRNSKSPNTNFYARAADSVETKWTTQEAEVSIPHRGMRLRLEGGTVKPGRGISNKTGQPTKSIALPTDKVPVVNEMRLRPKDAGILAFIPNRGGNPMTTGFLVEGIEQIIKRGPNKGKSRIVPKPGGAMLYVLRKQTEHAPNPEVLPSVADMLATASETAADYIASFEGGVA